VAEGNRRIVRRSLAGVVSSDRMDKTITVRVERTVRHPLYGKIMRRNTRLHAHDERNEARAGDLVTIEECRPISKTKSWRLRSVDAYESWYGAAHLCPFALDAFVYGLPEINRSEIRSAQMVACTGCYVAGALTPLVPLVRAELIDADDIVIDSKSGASGAGRALRESLLFCEVGEGCAAYSIGRHRHMAELEQELSRSAGRSVRVSFTPHLMPFSRGILSTQYVRGDALAIHRHLDKTFAEEPFVRLLPFGQVPRTQEVRGSNVIAIGVAADRRIGRAILVSALDNLVKGSAGQAVQNANLMLGLEETRGLPVLPLIP